MPGFSVPPFMKPAGGGGAITSAAPQQAVTSTVSPSAPSAAPVTQAVQQLVKLPRGILDVEFSLQNVSASLTDSQLYRVIADGAGAQGYQVGFVAPFKGSLVALTVIATAAISAGSLTLTFFRNSTTTGSSLGWRSGASAYNTIAPRTVEFSPGDILDLRITTDGSFAPTTTDIECFAYLAQDSSEES